MKKLIIAGRTFYALALMVYGLQQLYFGTFRDVFFSPYQQHLPLLNVLSYIFGIYLIATGVLIFIPGKGRKASLVMGGVFLSLFLCTQVPYQLISQPISIYHIGLWTAQLKELALAGGAFVVAYSFGTDYVLKENFLEKLAPYGNLFFLTTMTSFGISHILYGTFLVGIVPKWLPEHLFWVTFTGITLTAGGLAIILGLRIRIIALLLSLQIFLWLWMVHVPGTLSKPFAANRGNLLASAFDALAFSGIALLIALTMKKQKLVEDIENWV
ncbi:hypothetical protein ACFQZS_07325 [Mucilaginibacter calamicampi]|uniref:DoxX protein n=1 Tax=Mucilaginibacter calamicampi TaxID=1302352 RepID=A0ABW2YV48_9SPHI